MENQNTILCTVHRCNGEKVAEYASLEQARWFIEGTSMYIEYTEAGRNKYYTEKGDKS